MSSYSRTPLSKRSFQTKYQYGSSLNNQSVNGFNSSRINKREPICYVCKQDLYDEELDFHPCNCKYQICHQCYYTQVEQKDKKCPNCYKLYEVARVNEYIKKTTSSRKVKNISSTQETYSSSNMSSYSSGIKQSNYNNTSINNQHYKTSIATPKQAKKSPSQNKRTHSTDNNNNNNSNAKSHHTPQVKLSEMRILQKHILFMIGIAPSLAKDEVLRRYEYFGQYGQIKQITINKENAFQSENQGLCYSVYITYSTPQEASIAILAIDQFVYEGRLIRASFGRTKYCKFFLKDTACLNKDCPYQHSQNEGDVLLTQDDMQKKQLFQQCQQVAFQMSQVCMMSEEHFKQHLKVQREINYGNNVVLAKSIMPNPESIYEKKSLFKAYANLIKISQNHSTHSNINPTSSAMRQVNQKPLLNETKSNTIPQSTVKEIAKEPISNLERTKSLQVVKQESAQNIAYTFTPLIQNDTLQRQATVDNLASKDDQLKQRRRNNSSDERRRSKNGSSLSTVQKLEQQLAQSLQRHLGTDPSILPFESKQINQELQALNLFNEKKSSRFFSQEDEGEDDIDEILKPNSLSRRSSLCKKGTIQSLIVESLKFLNDDTDVVLPNKREPLLPPQQFKSNLPSEVFNVATPAQSHLGGNWEDDQTWNNTIFSQYEYNMYQQAVGGPIDDKSYYSHQGFNHQRFSNTIVGDARNSVFTNSYINANFQPLKTSTYANNDNSTILSNSIMNQSQSVTQRNFIPAANVNQIQPTNNNINPFNNSSGFNQFSSPFAGRKTIHAGFNQELISTQEYNRNIAGVPLVRSPSQPKYENQSLNKPTNNYENQIQQQLSSMQISQLQQRSVKGDLFSNNRLHSTSFDKQSYTLNQYNLELFDRKNETSKDLLYAKIFLQNQDGAASTQNNIISSQSLFCYNSQLDDEYYQSHTGGMSEYKKRQSNLLSERGGGQQVPRTPIKERMMRFTTDEDDYQQSDYFDNITKNSEPKNYYKEFLSLRENSIFSGNMFGRRRNSLEQDRDKLEPQQLQFGSPSLKVYGGGLTASIAGNSEQQQMNKKNSNSRSRQRKATALTTTNTVGF